MCKTVQKVRKSTYEACKEILIVIFSVLNKYLRSISLDVLSPIVQIVVIV